MRKKIEKKIYMFYLFFLTFLRIRMGKDTCTVEIESILFRSLDEFSTKVLEHKK